MSNFLKFKNIILPFIAFTLFIADEISCQNNAAIKDIMKAELSREFNILNKQEIPAYYLAYRMEYGKRYSLLYKNGKKIKSYWQRYANQDKEKGDISIEIRVGSPKLDNTRSITNRGTSWNQKEQMSFNSEVNKDLVRKRLWQGTHEAYLKAIEKYKDVLADQTKNIDKNKNIPDFQLKDSCVTYVDDIQGLNKKNSDTDLWQEKLKAITKIAIDDSIDIGLTGTLNATFLTVNFLNSEGCDIQETRKNIELLFIITCEDKDGTEIKTYKSYNAVSENDLPDIETIISDLKQYIEKLKTLRNAPLAKAYSAPAIISGSASGVFFHEILGHRVEAHRLKDHNDQHTFLDRINKNIVPSFISVDMDPTINTYKGKCLTGHYKYDDEGIKAQKVNIVENGILKTFLNSRKPLTENSKSNGHGRGSSYAYAVARQSNLIVNVKSRLTALELRNELKKQLKIQNKEYGFYIEQVAGGFTRTDVRVSNVFELIPTFVYKVFQDNRPDEMIRGVRFVGTPLLMFDQFVLAGGEDEVFSGHCGAESGGVPVSTVSPSFLLKSLEIQRVPDTNSEPKILKNPSKLYKKNEKL